MAKEVLVNPPPPGFQMVKIAKGDSPPHNGMPALDTAGSPVKRCYYVPVAHHAPTHAPMPSYLPTGSSTPPVNNHYPGQPQHSQPQHYAPVQQQSYAPVQQQSYAPVQQQSYAPAQPHQTYGAAPAAEKGLFSGHGHAAPSSSSGQWANVVHQGFTFPHQTKLEFKESAIGMTDANATVYDMATQREVFNIRGTYTRDFRGNHRVITSNGREVAQVGKSQGFDIKKMIKKELGLVNSGRCIYTAHGQQIASVAEKRFVMGAASELKMADGRHVDLDSGFRGKKFEAKHNGQLLFTIEHKTSAKSLLLGKDNYHITVEANVCCLLATATCLILEDLFRGEGGKR